MINWLAVADAVGSLATIAIVAWWIRQQWRKPHND